VATWRLSWVPSARYTLPKSEFVELKVYNILGKEVVTLASKKLNPGNHTLQFDCKNLASSVYYYQLVAGEWQAMKKMVLLRKAYFLTCPVTRGPFKKNI
jgi:hypothetical protein